MKILIILTIMLFATVNAFASRGEENALIFEDIIKSYEPQLEAKLGESIMTTIDENPEITLYYAFGNISVGRRILEEWTPLQVAFGTCHELGHVLGQWFNPQYFFAPEGEADYFAGGCLKKFLDSKGVDIIPLASKERLVSDAKCDDSEEINCNLIVSVVRGVLSTLSGTEVNENNLDPSESLPHIEEYIYTSYPSKNCRALTSINGALGLDRPSCWFYPGLVKDP